MCDENTYQLKSLSLFKVLISAFMLLFTLDTMTSFRAAVRRSTSSYSRKQSTTTFSRQQSTFSRQQSTTFSRQQSHEDRPAYSRQASSSLNVDLFPLTDKLSHFSVEQLPSAQDTNTVYDEDVPGELKVRITPTVHKLLKNRT